MNIMHKYCNALCIPKQEKMHKVYTQEVNCVFEDVNILIIEQKLHIKNVLLKT